MPAAPKQLKLVSLAKITVRVPTDTFRQVKLWAVRQDRSISSVATQALEEFLQSNQLDNQKEDL